MTLDSNYDMEIGETSGNLSTNVIVGFTPLANQEGVPAKMHYNTRDQMALLITRPASPRSTAAWDLTSALRKYHCDLYLSWPRAPLRVRSKLRPFSLSKWKIIEWPLL